MDPSPQLITTVWVSAVLGSVRDAFSVAVSFSLIGAEVKTGVTLAGATLLIVTIAVYSLSPLSLSLILPLTVGVPLSVVGQLAVFEGLSGAGCDRPAAALRKPRPNCVQAGVPQFPL